MIDTLDEAIKRMAEKFAAAGRELAPWPISPGHSDEEVAGIERQLRVQLPRGFRRVIRQYNFLGAVVGNVSMVQAETLDDWLVAPNVEPLATHLMKWWDTGDRPAHRLLIAQSDAHTFMLDTDDGAVVATWVDDPTQSPRRVAASFSLFYQGLASIYLAGLGCEEARSMAADVAQTVGSDAAFPFWARFAARAA